MRKPTAEQAKVIDAIVKGDSILVEATAGSGKSTTLAAAVVKLIKKSKTSHNGRGVIVVFNVKVAADLREKLDEALGTSAEAAGWSVRTFNSLGHGTLMANGYGKGKGGLTVDDKKNKMIVEKMLESDRGKAALLSCLTSKFAKNPGHYLHQAADLLVEIIAVCKTRGILASGFKSETAMRAIEVATENIGSEEMLQPTATLTKIVEACLRYNLELAKVDGIIDFADQIYIAVLHCKHIGRRWQTVIVDEVQDTNYLGCAQITRACVKQLVLVGDRHQVLFDSLRGADYALIDKLVKERKMKTYKLTVTFRCPHSVARRQVVNGPLKKFTPVATNKQGDIRYPFFQLQTVPTPGGTQVVKVWSFKAIAETMQSNLLDYNKKDDLGIIASTNADLIAAVAILCGEQRRPADELDLFYRGVRFPVTFWRRAASLRYGEGGSQALFAAKFYMAVTGASPDEACGQFMAAGDLSRSVCKLSAGTVHTVKGLEFNNVIIINGPSFYGKVAPRYVAETRTKNGLFGVKLSYHTAILATTRSPLAKAIKPYSQYRKNNDVNAATAAPLTPKLAFASAIKNVPDEFRAQLPSKGPKDTASYPLVKAAANVKRKTRKVS